MFFRYKRAFYILSISFMLMFGAALQPAAADEISGELRKWHRVTLTFDGPVVGEKDEVNPFLDYRLQVTFSHSGTGKTYVVPGFFAADGDAADTGAERGSKWRVHFTPDETGSWQYSAQFLTGSQVAISTAPFPSGSSSAGYFDGNTGSFDVARTNKSGDDLRGKGRLDYVNDHYLRFAENGEYFLKNGIDSPENFLAYDEFDGTYDAGAKGCTAGELFLHQYPVHVADWNSGDPTWGGGRGRGIIGAVNYIAATHGNSIYMITFNSGGGDGCDVWPWTSDTERYRFDVSKLDQWEIVFQHMQAKGVQIHLVLAERENRADLENSLGVQRRLYYRELAARFSHNLALQWNIGEEHNISNQRKRDYAQYIRDVDPYDHPISVHSSVTDPIAFYLEGSGGGAPIVGAPMYEASSIQGRVSLYNHFAITLRKETAAAGRPWAIYADEQAVDAPSGTDRRVYQQTHGTWGNLMGGGAGVEWFLSADLDLEDFSRELAARVQTQHAVDFFQNLLPFTRMEPANHLSSDTTAFVFHEPGKTYAVSLANGGSTNLDLSGHTGSYSVRWYDPRNGGSLQNGSKASVSGGGSASIGNPPSASSEHWVALLELSSPSQDPTASFSFDQTGLFVSFQDLSMDDGSVVSWDWDFGDGSSSSEQHPSHTYGAAGSYTVSLTVTDNTGASGSASESVVVVDGGGGTTGAFVESNGMVVMEAEHFAYQIERGQHSWATSAGQSGHSGTGAMVAGPDVNAQIKKADAQTAAPELLYPVNFTTPGTYYFWVRVFAPTADDNSVHGGHNDVISAGKLETLSYGSWVWTNVNTKGSEMTTGVQAAGMDTVHIWMREDGLYLDKILLTTDPGFVPTGAGPAESAREGGTPGNQNPVADFTFATNNLSTRFTDTSTDDGSITGWSWDFGDGATSTEQNPSHSYDAGGTYTVNLTVTDDQGAMAASSKQVSVDQPNEVPVAGFRFDASGLAVQFTDTSTDDGTLATWRWDFGDSNTSSNQHPSHTYTSAGSYRVILQVTDDGGLSDADTLTINVAEAGNGPFLASNGIVSMEVEHYMTKVDRRGHSWAETVARSGFSGDGAMRADPNVGELIRKNKASEQSPELIFDVDFESSGNYHIWVRLFAPSNSGKSFHAGLDDVLQNDGMEAETSGAWIWTNVDSRGFTQKLSVTSAGVHTVHLWMREDGVYLDKIVLTTDAGYTPSGMGPAESPRGDLSGNGAWRTRNLMLYPDAEGGSNETPATYALEGNYPNPFNPTTTIKFSLPEEGHVKLLVYDMQGRIVGRLLDGSVAAGNHMMTWDAGHLPSGVYLYRIEADGGAFSAVGRMILTK